MIYKTIRSIFITLDGEHTEIPEGTTLYKIPGDHMGNNMKVDYYSWNGVEIELEKYHDSLKKQ